MNQDEFNKHLVDVESAGAQSKVLAKLLDYVRVSTNNMDKYHSSWERAEDLWRGYRLKDKEDKKAEAMKEPSKLILPMAYAAGQTALSFLMLTFFQDERLFKLKSSGPEDQRRKEAYELDLAYQTSRQKTYLKFYNWFQDAFKYGFGVLEDCWHEEHQYFRTQETRLQEPGLIGSMLGRSPVEVAVETIKKIKTHEGLKLENITPYSFYPDPSVPLAEFQKGQYVACEDETTIAELVGGEGTTYYGTAHIKDTIPWDTYRGRNHRVGRNGMFANYHNSALGTNLKLGGAALKVRIEFKTTAKELKEEFDYDLSPLFPKDIPIIMVAVIANDQKLIKFEPLGYLHNKFSYNVIEYSPDHNSYSNPGIGDVIGELQDLSTWMLNSHVINVRKNIKNRLVVNPEFVELADIKNGSEIIRLKSNVQGRDIRQFLYSLELNDITRNHVNDIQVLNTFMQIITGINENALGQYSGGRRSATQSQSVQNAASARLKIHGKLFYNMGIEPLAQKMIANTNQLRSQEFWSYILGEDVAKYPYETTLLADSGAIANGFDFIPYEGTMPDEKQREAFLWQEFLSAMFSNPAEISAMTGADLNKLLHHYYELNGIKNSEDYFVSPEQQKELQAQVIPDERVQNNPNLTPA